MFRLNQSWSKFQGLIPHVFLLNLFCPTPLTQKTKLKAISKSLAQLAPQLMIMLFFRCPPQCVPSDQISLKSTTTTKNILQWCSSCQVNHNSINTPVLLLINFLWKVKSIVQNTRFTVMRYQVNYKTPVISFLWQVKSAKNTGKADAGNVK